MTELAQLDELIKRHHVYYTERVTEQVEVRALLIRDYTIAYLFPYTKPGIPSDLHIPKARSCEENGTGSCY